MTAGTSDIGVAEESRLMCEAMNCKCIISYDVGVAGIQRIFPVLKDRTKQIAGTLSGGEQQMLAIARALMGQPELLLMDEPSMGIAPLIVREIFDVIQQLNESGTTVLLVEQNAKAALKVAHHSYVLERGEIVLEGLAKELLDNPKVKEVYLGG